MVDVLVVLVVLAFFGASVAYVRLCDRIVGPDPTPVDAGAADDDVREEVAA